MLSLQRTRDMEPGLGACIFRSIMSMLLSASEQVKGMNLPIPCHLLPSNQRKERQRQKASEGQAASCKGLLVLWAWLSLGLNCTVVGRFFQWCLGYWFNMCVFPSCLHREKGCFNRPAPLVGNSLLSLLLIAESASLCWLQRLSTDTALASLSLPFHFAFGTRRRWRVPGRKAIKKKLKQGERKARGITCPEF